MTKYFDKDFFRFLLGFIAILCTSLIILIASKLYEAESKVETDSQVSSVVNFKN